MQGGDEVKPAQFSVDIPDHNGVPYPVNAPVVNANPHSGPLPLVDLHGIWQEDYCVMVGRLDLEYIRTQIDPRGRPHFALTDIALIDDNIATAMYPLFLGMDPYGSEYRYLERGICACFHQEAFTRGRMVNMPRGTIEVDGYEIRFELLPHRNSIVSRGTFRVSALGVTGDDFVPVASWVGEYFRRHGVLSQP